MTSNNPRPIKVQVYDPPMCCSSGVCGAEVDRNLVCFALSLQWLKMNGVLVERFNPSHQFDAFADNPVVVKAVNEHGMECLPLILVNGRIASAGTYPGRRELGELVGLGHPAAANH